MHEVQFTSVAYSEQHRPPRHVPLKQSAGVTQAEPADSSSTQLPPARRYRDTQPVHSPFVTLHAVHWAFCGSDSAQQAPARHSVDVQSRSSLHGPVDCVGVHAGGGVYPMEQPVHWPDPLHAEHSDDVPATQHVEPTHTPLAQSALSPQYALAGAPLQRPATHTAVAQSPSDVHSMPTPLRGPHAPSALLNTKPESQAWHRPLPASHCLQLAPHEHTLSAVEHMELPQAQHSTPWWNWQSLFPVTDTPCGS